MFSKQSRNLNLEWQFGFYFILNQEAVKLISINVVIFLGAFQYSDTNGSNGFDETDLVFLEGILDNPAVTQKFKVSKCFPQEKAKSLVFFMSNREKKNQTDSWLKAIFHKDTIPWMAAVKTEQKNVQKPVFHFTFIRLH